MISLNYKIDTEKIFEWFFSYPTSPNADLFNQDFPFYHLK